RVVHGHAANERNRRPDGPRGRFSRHAAAGTHKEHASRRHRHGLWFGRIGRCDTRDVPTAVRRQPARPGGVRGSCVGARGRRVSALRLPMLKYFFAVLVVALAAGRAATAPVGSSHDVIARFTRDPNPIALTGPARPSRYLEASGLRGAFLGREDGTFEAWVYPLKILHGFELSFHMWTEVSIGFPAGDGEWAAKDLIVGIA